MATKARRYRAARGAQFNQVDAQTIGVHLEKMELVTAETVVEDAVRKRSPLHKHFEWDDSIASERYRLAQARNLINHLEVIVITERGKESTRAFHNVTVQFDDETEGGIYAPISVVRQDQAMRSQVIRKAMAELRAWERRYKQYEDIFGPVIDAIDEVGELAAV